MQLLSEGSNNAAGQTATACGDDCAWLVLNVVPPVVRAMRAIMRTHRLQDLSVPQFRAMSLLSFAPRASLSCVADYIGSSLPAASRMIDGLVAKKLVVRQECSDDRRQVSLALTARGQSAIRRSRQETQSQLALRLARLTPAQHQTVGEAMKYLGSIFGSDAEANRPALPPGADSAPVPRVSAASVRRTNGDSRQRAGQ